MDFESELLPGTLIRRYKRFFAEILLDSGDTIIAHCANTGAMTGCAEPGFRVWVSPANNPKRKLQYTWELVENQRGELIGINTNRANKIVSHALKHQLIPELAAFDIVRPEYKPDGAASRFDFLLRQTNNTEQCLLEVKSLTLCEQHTGYFPDAVTTRGAKHCNELASLRSDSQRCVLLFCVQHTGVEKVTVAEHIDPAYASALRHAVDNGLEVMAYLCSITQEKIFINQKLTIAL
ncbi:DNA/RNA nuclease SfsA [Alteromonas facilis]|uniref:DNA/RNA nuclease SfsA n=1 Tax=Alteromonas facilis TaxID=2048004 RepID=UPI000C282013|nr:DNA/RNA nuclease SfsA [Alteromonas facilis]